MNPNRNSAIGNRRIENLKPLTLAAGLEIIR
jgi:hypothetical protein